MHEQEEQEEQPPSASFSSPSSPSSQTQHDDSQESRAQTSWRSHSPSLSSPSQYNPFSSQVDEEHTSRSATLSPGLSTAPTAASIEPTTSSRREIGSRPDPEGMILSEDHDEDEKDADMVDPMLGISSTRVGDAVGGDSGEIEAERVGWRQSARAQLIPTLAESDGPRRGGLAEPSSRNWRRPDLVGEQSTTVEGERLGHGRNLSGDSDVMMEAPPMWVADSSMLGMGYEYAGCRVIPVSPSSYLRPGSRFHGTQQSERQRYDVQVEIKHVDLRESFLCGYLRIQGLTEDHPTLTTYFEGEIIGTKYGFTTQHPSWGASDKTDMSHWGKFQAFRPIQKLMKKGGNRSVVIHDVANCENIFMRWKEHFLVPDHRVRTIHGASFEGFYYICFNQLRGEVSGIYFHSKSEK